MDDIRGVGAPVAGAPMQVSVDNIDEDPDQPRREFDEESLAQLATTIAGRGVRQPVSVRRHPQRPGRWILNFGARRLRAAKLAGESTIAAFEDASCGGYDQVIENEQREGLTPLEIAAFVERRLALGDRQADIARGIGKSEPYVTYACSLIDPPGWLMQLYRSGKCRGLFELHELRRLHATHPGAVEEAIAGVARIGRSELKRLRARLGDTREARTSGRPPPASSVVTEPEPVGSLRPAPHTIDASDRRRMFVRASHEGSVVRVLLDELPDSAQSVFVVSEDGTRIVAPIGQLDHLGDPDRDDAWALARPCAPVIRARNASDRSASSDIPVCGKNPSDAGEDGLEPFAGPRLLLVFAPMARRSKASSFDDSVAFAALMPWWACVAVAVISYFALGALARPVVVTGIQSNQLPLAMARSVMQGLATVAQYLVPLVCLLGAVVSASQRRRRSALLDGIVQSEAPDALHGISWREFELLVGEAYRLQGYEVAEVGGAGADGGVDLVLRKDREKFLVQCKQWKAFKVGVTVVRELYGVMAAEGAAGGFVVTAGRFTDEAIEFASGRNVTLVDGPKLHALVRPARAARPSSKRMETRVHQRPVTPFAASMPFEAEPACPSCSGAMVRRTAKRGDQAGTTFWGCAKYPACRGTRLFSAS